jgi:hypothetical protein
MAAEPAAVKSCLGQAMTFTITLPLDAAQAETEPAPGSFCLSDN